MSNSFEAQMNDILDDVRQETRKAGARAIKSVSKESVQTLRNTSPSKTGSYRRGWSAKQISEMEIIVHNRTDYQKTHLLENGHVIRNKKGTYGRTRGIKHIAPVAEWAATELPREIMEELQ